MAENDIYNSERQYKSIKAKVFDGGFCKPDPEKKITYFIKNKDNIIHFKKLLRELETKDISFIRRIGYIKALKKVCSCTNKNLKDLTQDDVKDIILKLNTEAHKTLTSRRDFVYYNRYAWKLLFPELDSKGRPDDSVVPFSWRIKVHADKSREKDKLDKFTHAEYARILKALNRDTRMQCFYSLLYETLARPQELCYCNLKDVEMFDSCKDQNKGAWKGRN